MSALPPPPPESETPQPPAWMRPIYMVAGLIMLALGIIGAFLPVMPTTIFLILAAWCFARSSQRLESWLMNHPQFGPVLQAWRREGAIPRKGKIMAVGGMVLGFALFLLGAHPRLELMVAVLLILAACGAYVVSRPEPSAQGKKAQ